MIDSLYLLLFSLTDCSLLTFSDALSDIGFRLSDIGVELQRLVPHHLLQQLLRGLEVVPSPVEGLLGLGLGLFIVQAFEVGVLQALLHGVAFFGVEDQHLAEQVERHWVCLWIQRLPALFVSLW